MSTPEPPRVLAIHAHPDDVEFQCAGTLALLRRAGCLVTIATMTPGDCGSDELDAEAIAATRRSEARAAAAEIGAEATCLEFRDVAIFEDDSARRRVVEALRRARPDLILSAPTVDYHVDHEVTGRLVRDACFAAVLPNYATRQWEPAPPLPRIPTLYFVDSLGGMDREARPIAADFHVDITDVFEIKRAMLSRHASQRNWLKRMHGMDEYLDSLATWSSRRGSEIGVSYAEGFRQYVGHPYPAENRLLTLIGQDGRGNKVAQVGS